MRVDLWYHGDKVAIAVLDGTLINHVKLGKDHSDLLSPFPIYLIVYNEVTHHEPHEVSMLDQVHVHDVKVCIFGLNLFKDINF